MKYKCFLAGYQKPAKLVIFNFDLNVNKCPILPLFTVPVESVVATVVMFRRSSFCAVSWRPPAQYSSWDTQFQPTQHLMTTDHAVYCSAAKYCRMLIFWIREYDDGILAVRGGTFIGECKYWYIFFVEPCWDLDLCGRGLPFREESHHAGEQLYTSIKSIVRNVSTRKKINAF